MKSVSEHMYGLMRDLKFDVLCGVPYTALPIATLISANHQIPLVLRRKEGPKAYGLKRMIEGIWEPNQTVLVIEDLVTSGISVFETIGPLEESGLHVRDIVVLIDREQGGRDNIQAKGNYKLHSVLTISFVLQVLVEEGKISREVAATVQEFIRNTKVALNKPSIVSPDPNPSPLPTVYPRMSYSERVAHCTNEFARQLFQLMDKKKSNLCVSADVTTRAELFELIEHIGPSIVLLKLHIDILLDFEPSVVHELQRLSKIHDFFIFEDRKFADIGSTVMRQYEGGVYRMVEWSHLINCHIIAGKDTIVALQQAAAQWRQRAQEQEKSNPAITPRSSAHHSSPRGLLLIAEMSSEGSLATGAYTEAAVQMAQQHQDFVAGFISQHAVSKHPGMIHMTPGVQLPAESDIQLASASSSRPSSASSVTVGTRTGTDNLGQQYHSPYELIRTQGTDVVIVGRAILKAKDVKKECERYRQAAWQAYEQSLEDSKMQEPQA